MISTPVLLIKMRKRQKSEGERNAPDNGGVCDGWIKQEKQAKDAKIPLNQH
jgi:hypothetical protein